MTPLRGAIRGFSGTITARSSGRIHYRSDDVAASQQFQFAIDTRPREPTNAVSERPLTVRACRESRMRGQAITRLPNVLNGTPV